MQVSLQGENSSQTLTQPLGDSLQELDEPSVRKRKLHASDAVSALLRSLPHSAKLDINAMITARNKQRQVGRAYRLLDPTRNEEGERYSSDESVCTISDEEEHHGAPNSSDMLPVNAPPTERINKRKKEDEDLESIIQRTQRHLANHNRLRATMSTTLRLNCLIEAESIVFLVNATREDVVSDLKERIQSERALDSLKGVDPHTLELWKPKDSNPITAKPRITLVKRIGDLGDDLVDELDAVDNLLSIFPIQPPRNYIHIIVKVRRTETISPATSHDSNLSQVASQYPWLGEIHHKLWDKSEMFGEIFRSAQLTKEDFIELQNKLEEIHPQRLSESYVPQDVLSMKSEFLHSKSTALERNFGDDLVPRLDFDFDISQPLFHDDDNDDDDDDDDDNDDDDDDDDGAAHNEAMVVDPNEAMVIDPNEAITDPNLDHLLNEATTIFPYTLRYVDLTVLKSQTTRTPQLMLFRNEWAAMIDIFNKRRKGLRGSVVFTGQPGIGKTCFLYSILILCLLRAQPIVFQSCTGEIFIIDCEGVRPSSDLQVVSEQVAVSNGEVLTLVDADGDFCKPRSSFFNDLKHRILLTSSSRKREDRKWLTQHVKDSTAEVVTEPWSREELVVASLFLHETDITLKRLQETSRICGNIPRRCFDTAAPQNHLKSEIRIAIGRTKELHDIYDGMRSSEPIHPAFQVRPLSSRDRDMYSCLIEPVSDFALSQIREVLYQRDVEYTHMLYRAMKGSGSYGGPVGKMFENYVHPYLRNPQTSKTFVIKSLGNGSATPLEIHFPSDENHYLEFGDMNSFSSQLKPFVARKTSCYLKPVSPIFPSFDSFLYQPNIVGSGFSPLIALQITIATNDDIKVKGLAKVQTSLKPRIPELNKVRPLISRKMIILFVVPKELEEVFGRQRITPNTDVWYGKTDQYVLGLSEKEVLEAR